jgi:DNA-binding Xre family transcriptional regulator
LLGLLRPTKKPATGPRPPPQSASSAASSSSRRRAVSRRSGLSYKAVHDLYHDRTRRYDAETLDRLCRALWCQITDIIEYVPDPEPEPAESV